MLKVESKEKDGEAAGDIADLGTLEAMAILWWDMNWSSSVTPKTWKDGKGDKGLKVSFPLQCMVTNSLKARYLIW